jgi:tRNA uridine 5-carboxymethylaminomethyl modification enzyme
MESQAIVIGGGHAGIEAALGLSRIGLSTILITQSLDCIGRLSCNPAIGGLSKGNIVREIDALGGEMGKLIDRTMIQFRLLNRSRGPAVQAPRAQADKQAYALLAKQTLELQPNLSLFQDTVIDLVHSENRVQGVVTERGRTILAGTVVLTTGTFMDGKIYIGDHTASSGRLGEPAAVGLGDNLRKMGFSTGRLKTGTPARVLRSSLNLSMMDRQSGDEQVFPFSFSTDKIDRPNGHCYITFTNENTHRIIRDNMDKSPLYSGKIEGVGPRYCPSIEDKVMRFPDRERHHIFVEPEGLSTEEMYLNGISSSLPEEVQEAFLRTIPGMEDLVIMRPGYAVEYAFLDPTQLFPNLETKRLKGLFVAGQTNGTSGYEEAACQGLMAGINAARYIQGREPLILNRSEAYIGVLIDDLVTMGTREPYRMFTSRAEYRLSLRHNSADIRLLGKGHDAGLQSSQMLERLQQKIDGIEEIKEILKKRNLGSRDVSLLPRLEKHLGQKLYQVVKDPEYVLEDLLVLDPHLGKFSADWLREAELDIKYEGYIRRQDKQVERFKKLENMKIPADYDFSCADGISSESREKLQRIRPLSVGQASRISGVRNSDIAVLMILLKKRHK